MTITATVPFLGKDYPVVYITAGDSFPGLRDVPYYGFDIETYGIVDHPQAGLQPHMTAIRLIQIFDGVVVYVIDWKSFDIKTVRIAGQQSLIPIVNRSYSEFYSKLYGFLRTKRLIAHNAMFEIMHIKHNFGTDINCECTMLMEQLYLGTMLPAPAADEDDTEDTIPDDSDGLSRSRLQGVSLEACIARHFSVAVDKSEQNSKWGEDVLTSKQIAYAALDAVVTYFLVTDSIRLLKKYDQVKIYQLQRSCLHPIAMMHLEGFPIDWDAHEKAIVSWETDLANKKLECSRYFGETLNTQSTKQLGIWLLQNHPELADRWPRTEKGQFSFSANNLLDYIEDSPAIAALHSTKKLSKLVSSFGKGLTKHRNPITGRLHTSYNIGRAGTGRMTSSSPNLQQQVRDKEFRSLYKAPPGYLMVVADFSQIELRLQAECSGDEVMRAVYRDKKDIYITMASQLYGIDETALLIAYKAGDIGATQKRHFGKTIMLSLGYGMGARKLKAYAKYSAKPSIDISDEQAAAAHRLYHDTFSGYSHWCQTVRLIAEEKDCTVRTLYGKVRKLDPMFVYTQAPNTYIQGTAAELMMQALVNLYDSIRGTSFKIIGVIHDEIVALAPVGEEKTLQELTSRAMNDAMKQCFPDAVSHDVAEAHSGVNWAEAK